MTETTNNHNNNTTGGGNRRKTSLLVQSASTSVGSSGFTKRTGSSSATTTHHHTTTSTNTTTATHTPSSSSNMSVLSGVSNGSNATKSSSTSTTTTATTPTTSIVHSSAIAGRSTTTTPTSTSKASSGGSGSVIQPSMRKSFSRSGSRDGVHHRSTTSTPTNGTDRPHTPTSGLRSSGNFANSSSNNARLKLEAVLHSPVSAGGGGGGTGEVLSPNSTTGSTTSNTTVRSSTSQQIHAPIAQPGVGAGSGLTASQLQRLSLQSRSRSNSINRSRSNSQSRSQRRGSGSSTSNTGGGGATSHLTNNGHNSPATLLSQHGNRGSVAGGALTVQDLLGWSPAASPVDKNGDRQRSSLNQLFQSFPDMDESSATNTSSTMGLLETAYQHSSNNATTTSTTITTAASTSNEPEMIKVCVRVRPPFISKEDDANNSNNNISSSSMSQSQELLGWSWTDTQITSQLSKRMVNTDPNAYLLHSANTGLMMMGSGTQYTFDHVYGPETKNDQIFEEMIQTIVTNTMQGFNGSVFSYGQTSSGKTFTMNGTTIQPGIIPLAIQYVFTSIQQYPEREFLIRVSYMEVYNETIKDLLSNTKDLTHHVIHAGNMHTHINAHHDPSGAITSQHNNTGNSVNPSNNKDDAIKIQYDPKLGTVVVTGVKEQVVVNPQQCLALIKAGESHRHIGVTDMNEKSSRAHTLFKLVIESRDKRGGVATSTPSSSGKHTPVAGGGGGSGVSPVRVSTLYLVDLAGSESAKMTNSKGERAREAKFINQSLLTLSTIIQRLSEDHSRMPPSSAANPAGAAVKRSHLPYRDSKLTRLLEPALDGNARIAIICTISPTMRCFDETANTLKFATRAKAIKLHARLNETLDAKTLLRAYREEIDMLRLKVREMEEQQRMMSHSLMIHPHHSHSHSHSGTPSLDPIVVNGTTTSPSGTRGKSLLLSTSPASTSLLNSTPQRTTVTSAGGTPNMNRSSPPTIVIPGTTPTNSPIRTADSNAEEGIIDDERNEDMEDNISIEGDDNYFPTEEQAMMLQMISEMERLILKADVDLKEQQHSVKLQALAFHHHHNQQRQEQQRLHQQQQSHKRSHKKRSSPATTVTSGNEKDKLHRPSALESPLRALLTKSPFANEHEHSNSSSSSGEQAQRNATNALVLHALQSTQDNGKAEETKNESHEKEVPIESPMKVGETEGGKHIHKHHHHDSIHQNDANQAVVSEEAEKYEETPRISNAPSTDSATWMSVASTGNSGTSAASDSCGIATGRSEAARILRAEESPSPLNPSSTQIDRDEDGIAMSSSSMEDNEDGDSNRSKKRNMKLDPKFAPATLLPTPVPRLEVVKLADKMPPDSNHLVKEAGVTGVCSTGIGETVEEEGEDDVDEEQNVVMNQTENGKKTSTPGIFPSSLGTASSSSFMSLKRENSISIEGLISAYSKLEGHASKAGIVAPIATAMIPPVAPLRTYSLQELTSPCPSPSVSSVSSVSSFHTSELHPEAGSGSKRKHDKGRSQPSEFAHAFPRPLNSNGAAPIRGGGVAMIAASADSGRSTPMDDNGDEIDSPSSQSSFLSSTSVASTNSILGSRSFSELDSQSGDSEQQQQPYPGNHLHPLELAMMSGSMRVPTWEIDTTALNNVSKMLLMLKELIAKKPVTRRSKSSRLRNGVNGDGQDEELSPTPSTTSSPLRGSSAKDDHSKQTEGNDASSSNKVDTDMVPREQYERQALELKLRIADNAFLQEEVESKQRVLDMLTDGLKEVEFAQKQWVMANQDLTFELEKALYANQILRNEVFALNKRVAELTGVPMTIDPIVDNMTMVHDHDQKVAGSDVHHGDNDDSFDRSLNKDYSVESVSVAAIESEHEHDHENEVNVSQGLVHDINEEDDVFLEQPSAIAEQEDHEVESVRDSETNSLSEEFSESEYNLHHAHDDENSSDIHSDAGLFRTVITPTLECIAVPSRRDVGGDDTRSDVDSDSHYGDVIEDGVDCFDPVKKEKERNSKELNKEAMNALLREEQEEQGVVQG